MPPRTDLILLGRIIGTYGDIDSDPDEGEYIFYDVTTTFELSYLNHFPCFVVNFFTGTYQAFNDTRCDELSACGNLIDLINLSKTATTP